jgi:hypothetical protein
MRNQRWFDAMVSKGHTPIIAPWTNDPVLDIFVTDVGFHNGPGCATCGWTCCMHCDEIADIPECDQKDKS